MSFNHDDDKPREECGIVGLYGCDQAAPLVALGLHALQHRGQEACGITTFDGHRFHGERHTGLVGEHFSGDLTKRLPGQSGIGHNRYSTQGKTVRRNIQPIYADLDSGGFAIAHNGNLTNARALRRRLVRSGSIFQSTMDTEVILHLIAHSDQATLADRFLDAICQIEGGFALVCLTNRKLIGVRDPSGLRPLVLGRIGLAHVLASETCALDLMGAKFVRDIEPGEVVMITREGLRTFRPFPPRPVRPCLFEYIYFARPDSIVQGRSVYETRRQMGHQLAIEHAAPVDVVVPVPDSGVPAAIGFSEHSGIPFQLGIIRSHYVGRTFIQPGQAGRQRAVSRKHSPNQAVVRGKRVVLIDDSIVRGNTSRRIVQMVREAGAKEVHFRSASPPIMYQDFYGIDMADRNELLAANHSLQEIQAWLGVDSLGFLSVPGLYKAIGHAYDPQAPHFADHYFTGNYPTPLTDHDHHESGKTCQLSLLDEKSSTPVNLDHGG